MQLLCVPSPDQPSVGDAVVVWQRSGKLQLDKMLLICLCHDKLRGGVDIEHIEWDKSDRIQVKNSCIKSHQEKDNSQIAACFTGTLC